nr:hypothetical protein [Lactobacillus delbrueckii]
MTVSAVKVSLLRMRRKLGKKLQEESIFKGDIIMKNTDLMDAMGGIKTEYIVEAAASRGQKKVIPLSAKRKPGVRLVAGIGGRGCFQRGFAKHESAGG